MKIPEHQNTADHAGNGMNPDSVSAKIHTSIFFDHQQPSPRRLPLPRSRKGQTGAHRRRCGQSVQQTDQGDVPPLPRPCRCAPLEAWNGPGADPPKPRRMGEAAARPSRAAAWRRGSRPRRSRSRPQGRGAVRQPSDGRMDGRMDERMVNGYQPRCGRDQARWSVVVGGDRSIGDDQCSVTVTAMDDGDG